MEKEPKKKLTFIDSNVLIAAARGTDEVSDKEMAIIDDPDRFFASSKFVKLEVIPKAIYNGKREEQEFYEQFFKEVAQFVEISKNVIDNALSEASIIGLSAMDALHISSAKVAKVDEFVTAEKETKPIFRVSNLMITSIRLSNPA